MKQIVRTGGGGGRGRWRTPTEEEVEVVEILLSLPKLCAKSELIRRCSFDWGRKKKRSVLDSKSESLPSPSPLTKTPIDEGVTENVTAVEADKSPSTPLCFLPSGSGSDGADHRKPPSSAVRKVLKRKETDDLMDVYSKMQQEKEILKKKVKAMETLRQELTSQNLELKARGQKINYPRNMEDFNIWWNNMRAIDQQRCHQQITMFTPAPPHYYHHQQLVVDPNNGKPVALSCSTNSNGGGRFGIFNQIDPRVMGSSQPLDQSKYLAMDNDLRARAAAAAARKRRKLRMKKEVEIEEDDVNDPSVKIHHGESYDFMACSQPLDQSQYMVNDFMAAASSSQPLDQSKYLVMDDDDLRFRSEAAAARKRRILRMKESKNSLLAMKLSGASACR
ncbi:hypothetical protein SSX86_020609 [Deinandra increscens subsp. villosa]|uniref:Uncharacterized protein n=1 Tax=Deinandra increscens subsp. villosa TaxID=3103831 RepID=A0AAP0CN91_9ASTR